MITELKLEWVFPVGAGAATSPGVGKSRVQKSNTMTTRISGSGRRSTYSYDANKASSTEKTNITNVPDSARYVYPNDIIYIQSVWCVPLFMWNFISLKYIEYLGMFDIMYYFIIYLINQFNDLTYQIPVMLLKKIKDFSKNII